MRRVTTTAPGIFFAALAASVLLFSEAVRSMPGADQPQAPKNVRKVDDASPQTTGAWTRVIVELNVPDREHPEASRRNRTAVLAQGQVIASRRTKVLAGLPADSYRLVRDYQTIPYVALAVNSSALAALRANDRDVVRVLPDAVNRPELADSGPLVQADQAWAAGFDGTGFDVAIVDTGVDPLHPFLAGKVAVEACYSNTVAGSSQTLCANGLSEQHGAGAAAACAFGDCYHGTHIAGVAAGDGTRAGQPFSGIAKGANVIAIQVFSQLSDPAACGGTSPCIGAFTSDILAALESVYLLSWDRQIAAVNLSLGAGLFASCDDQPYASIIASLKSVGIATVVASGNAASTSMLASPACASGAVSVGSSSKADVLSWFSNVSTTLSLLAPGENVVSAVNGGGYGALSGTSVAAAHVAGAFAVARQAAPTADVDTILTAFRQTGLPIVDGRSAAHTVVPRLRLFQALTRLVTIPNPSPTVTWLDPSGARAGDPALTLTIDGTGFDAFSVATWNGSARPTTVVSTTKLAVAIAAADLASVGTASVAVMNPTPGGGTSAALPFAIDPPAKLTLSATRVGPSADVTVTLANGYGGATDWMALAATGAPDNNYLQSTNVGAGVTSRSWTLPMPTVAGTYEFRLFVNGIRKATSPVVTVDLALTPTPIATSISPSSATAGASPFALTVTGSRFMPWSVVQWNGANRATTFVSGNELRASIDAGDVAAAALVPVRVVTPAPGGGASQPLTFTVNNPAPTLTSVSPTVVTAGGSSFTLTVKGSGFVSTSVARWNGADRPTTFVNDSQLLAAISASDIASAGAAQVTVNSPTPGGGTTAAAAITVANPVPSVGSLSPSTVIVGSPTFTVTVNGSGFVATSMARWNGAPRATTYIGPSQLAMTIAAADVVAAGTAQVTVDSPAPGGGTSNNATFTVANPMPAATTLSPSSVIVGSSAFTLTVNGSGFVPASVVRWNGTPRTTTYVGPAQLTASIGAADIASAGTAQVTVDSPAPGGGTSSPVVFTTMNPAPAATSLSPVGAKAGSTAFTLTVNGSGFVPSSVVQWNGSPRPTTYVGGNQLTAAISAADIATAGTAQVGVATPVPGGGTCASLAFPIVSPVPTLTVPNTTVPGGSSVTVTLSNGLGGSQDWIALADSAAPNTTYITWTYVGAGVTTTTWSVTMPTTGGPYEFRLFLNNGFTRAATSPQITVLPPSPTITTMSPTGAIAGSASVNLVVNGANFTPSSVVRWNGSNRATTYFGPTQLAATIPASDLATATTAQVTVFAPAPGGGTSNAMTFTVGAGPALGVSATTVSTGASVTVTLTNGLGGSLDWIAFAPATAPDTTYIQFVYVGTGVATRTWTVTVPGPGKYEFRLFLNNGFTRAATSPTVTVQ